MHNNGFMLLVLTASILPSRAGCLDSPDCLCVCSARCPFHPFPSLAVFSQSQTVWWWGHGAMVPTKNVNILGGKIHCKVPPAPVGEPELSPWAGATLAAMTSAATWISQDVRRSFQGHPSVLMEGHEKQN